MSFQITTAFVQQYKDNMYMLSQQKGSRLRDAVTLETGVVGKSVFIDQFGATSMQQKTGRHTDTPLISTPFSRRKIDIAPYEWADLTDNPDIVRTLNDPTNKLVMAGMAAAGRTIDDIVIASAFATAYTGETGSTTVAFPASQQVAVNDHNFDSGTGDVGLTVGKLIAAKTILDENEVESEDRYICAPSRQINNLLTNAEVTSADYNTIKALVRGEVDTYLGFNFIRSEQIDVDDNGDYRVMAWQKKGLALAIGRDVTGRISERDDKSYATQVYFELDMGASRLEEERVVEIKCDPLA